MTTTPNPIPARVSFVGWIAANRERASYALVGFGIVMIIATIFLGLRGDRVPNEASANKDKEKSKDLSDLMPKEKQKDSQATVAGERNPDYLWAAIWASCMGVTLVGLGLWNINRAVKADQEPFMARILILATGGTAGILTALLGLKLGYHWEESLNKWISTGAIKEAQWVLAALAILVFGLGITFVSLQQARTEIRNQPTIRRLVYGYNFGLTGLLIIILLVAVNLLASAKLPATLDATEGGFYSLDAKSEQLLKDINQPIHAYFIASSNLIGAFTTDVRNLFANCAKVNPSFKYTFLLPGINREEISQLYDRLKISEADKRQGLILTVGEQEEHVAFISVNDLATIKVPDRPRQPNEQGAEQAPQLIFEGEPKIMTQLQYLAEGKVKPVIYFTQGAGEPVLHPTPQTRNVATAKDLLDYLGSRNFDVRTIVLSEEKNTRWMKEATALVVFGPTRPLSPEEFKLVREYMKPTDGSKGGKLLALLPPMSDKLNSPGTVAKTGLEPLLAEFGVSVPAEQVYIKPREIQVARDQTVAIPHIEIVGDPEFLASRNPLAGLIQDHQIFTRFGVRPVQPAPVPAFHVEKLLVTTDQFPVWFETNITRRDALLMFQALEADPALAREKRLGKQHVPVALLVSEGQNPGIPRAAVFGMSSFIADHGLRMDSPEPPLISTCLPARSTGCGKGPPVSVSRRVFTMFSV